MRLGKNDPDPDRNSQRQLYSPFPIPKLKLRIPESGEKIELTRNKPVVAVLPFRNISKDSSRDFFADGLGEQLSTELTWFQDLSVISYYSSRHVAGKTSDIKEAADAVGSKIYVNRKHPK